MHYRCFHKASGFVFQEYYKCDLCSTRVAVWNFIAHDKKPLIIISNYSWITDNNSEQSSYSDSGQLTPFKGMVGICVFPGSK